MIILDGLGDRPSATLGGATPLEAARTPNLDGLVAEGIGGLVHPLAPGVPVGTQIGVGLLMGLARADIPSLSRGPVEAAGVGLPVSPRDVAFRCNFATLQRQGARMAIIDRRAGRVVDGMARLAGDLDGLELPGGGIALVRASTQHRAVLVLKGENLSEAVTDTDPGAGREAEGLLPCRPLTPEDDRAVRTARLVNDFLKAAHARMHDHPVNRERVRLGALPVNGLLTRGAGRLHPVRNLIRHLGLRTAVVAGEGTILGLSRLFGFEILTDERFTAFSDTDLALKVEKARQALTTHDLVVLHIKGTDTYAHDHDPAGKQGFIERIDAALTPLLGTKAVIGVTGDHSTDSGVGRHTGDPVPALIFAPKGRTDGVTGFSERECLGGALGHLSATSFLCTLLDHMDAMHNHRAHEYVYY